MLNVGSGTTGMPKGCPFHADRGFMSGISVHIFSKVKSKNGC